MHNFNIHQSFILEDNKKRRENIEGRFEINKNYPKIGGDTSVETHLYIQTTEKLLDKDLFNPMKEKLRTEGPFASDNKLKWRVR